MLQDFPSYKIFNLSKFWYILMKEQSHHIKCRGNTLSLNIKFFLSSTSIIFFYCWIFLLTYIYFEEFNLFNRSVSDSSPTNIFSRTDDNFSFLLSFLILYFVILVSILTIDILFKDSIKIHKLFMILIAIVLITRRLVLLDILGNNEMAAGFIVGSFFYSTTAVALIPFFIIHFRNNIYSNEKYRIPYGFLTMTLLFVFEYIIHILFINHSIKISLLPSVSNFSSYLLAFFSFVFLKKNTFLKLDFPYNTLSEIIIFISTVLGLPIFMLFLIFA